MRSVGYTYTKMCFQAGSCRTPLGELTELPEPPSWIRGGRFAAKGEGEMRREKGKGGEGRNTL